MKREPSAGGLGYVSTASILRHIHQMQDAFDVIAGKVDFDRALPATLMTQIMDELNTPTGSDMLIAGALAFLQGYLAGLTMMYSLTRGEDLSEDTLHWMLDFRPDLTH